MAYPSVICKLIDFMHVEEEAMECLSEFISLGEPQVLKSAVASGLMLKILWMLDYSEDEVSEDEYLESEGLF